MAKRLGNIPCKYTWTYYEKLFSGFGFKTIKKKIQAGK